MRLALRRIWRVIPLVSLSIVVAQLVATLGLTAAESRRKKRRKLRRFPHTTPEPVAVGQDTITVYTYGQDLYDDMLASIHSAKAVIFFETFIWKSDEVGSEFKQALIDAAERGVRVYVIWDGFANLVVPSSFFRLPGSIAAYRLPVLPLPWSPRTWGRDHRKLLVVDGVVGFLGGYNIGSLYATGWRDTHARIEGPAVADIENAFIDFWNVHAKQSLGVELASEMRRPWNATIQLHRNTPRIQVYPIRNMYLEAIDRASVRIWLTHAYLIPDDDLIFALVEAVERGVDVRIIVPAESNHVVADWLSRVSYHALLSRGVRVFLYQNAMVHAKTATIDSVWSTIGTANIDRISLLGNYEINIEVFSAEVARQLEAIFEVDRSNSRQLSATEWGGRHAMVKFSETVLAPLRPLL